MAQCLIQKIHMGQIIQVNDRSQLAGQLEFLRRSLVGGEHDVMSGKAATLAHHQLREGRTVHPASLVPQELQDSRRGSGFDGKVFLEPRIPRKGSPERAGCGANAFLVIDVERGGVGLNDLPGLVQGEKWTFHLSLSPLGAADPLWPDSPPCAHGQSRLRGKP